MGIGERIIEHPTDAEEKLILVCGRRRPGSHPCHVIRTVIVAIEEAGRRRRVKSLVFLDR